MENRKENRGEERKVKRAYVISKLNASWDTPLARAEEMRREINADKVIMVLMVLSHTQCCVRLSLSLCPISSSLLPSPLPSPPSPLSLSLSAIREVKGVEENRIEKGKRRSRIISDEKINYKKITTNNISMKPRG